MTVAFVILTLATSGVSAQSLSGVSMGFAGGYLKSESGSLTFSAGEAITGDFSNETFSFQAPVSASATITPTSLDRIADLPSRIELYQNYPNPFNPSTQIRFALPQQSSIRILIYNTIGSLVSQIDMGERPAGHHQVAFDASGFASGVYLYSLQVDGSVFATRKMTLIR